MEFPIGKKLFLGIFQWDEPTKRVPFTAKPEIPEILSKWKVPLGSRGTGPVKLAESPLWWDGPEWLSKSKRECLKLQLVDHPPTIMPEMKTGKKQETEFTAYVSLYTNQPQNVTKLYQTATYHGRLEIGSKVLLQLELISPCLCKSEGELFSTCQESKRGKSIRCCYCMKAEKLGTRWCGHASVKRS